MPLLPLLLLTRATPAPLTADLTRATAVQSFALRTLARPVRSGRLECVAEADRGWFDVVGDDDDGDDASSLKRGESSGGRTERPADVTALSLPPPSEEAFRHTGPLIYALCTLRI